MKIYDASGVAAPATRGRGLALFQSGNAILFVALLAAFLQGLAQLVTHSASWPTLSSLLLTTVASYAAIAVVPAGSWRRLYWTTSFSMTGLSLLTIHVLSLLTGWQKFEIFCVIIGIVLIVAGYINRFREQPGEYGDSLTLGLWIGSGLVTLPLLIALCYWRFNVGNVHWPEELAIVAFSILMLVTGFSWQVKVDDRRRRRNTLPVSRRDDRRTGPSTADRHRNLSRRRGQPSSFWRDSCSASTATSCCSFRIRSPSARGFFRSSAGGRVSPTSPGSEENRRV